MTFLHGCIVGALPAVILCKRSCKHISVDWPDLLTLHVGCSACMHAGGTCIQTVNSMILKSHPFCAKYSPQLGQATFTTLQYPILPAVLGAVQPSRWKAIYRDPVDANYLLKFLKLNRNLQAWLHPSRHHWELNLMLYWAILKISTTSSWREVVRIYISTRSSMHVHQSLTIVWWMILCDQHWVVLYCLSNGTRNDYFLVCVQTPGWRTGYGCSLPSRQSLSFSSTCSLYVTLLISWRTDLHLRWRRFCSSSMPQLSFYMFI